MQQIIRTGSCAAFLAASLCQVALGQNSGAVVGTMKDPSEMSVPDAAVELKWEV